MLIQLILMCALAALKPATINPGSPESTTGVSTTSVEVFDCEKRERKQTIEVPDDATVVPIFSPEGRRIGRYVPDYFIEISDTKATPKTSSYGIFSTPEGLFFVPQGSRQPADLQSITATRLIVENHEPPHGFHLFLNILTHGASWVGPDDPHFPGTMLMHRGVRVSAYTKSGFLSALVRILREPTLSYPIRVRLVPTKFTVTQRGRIVQPEQPLTITSFASHIAGQKVDVYVGHQEICPERARDTDDWLDAPWRGPGSIRQSDVREALRAMDARSLVEVAIDGIRFELLAEPINLEKPINLEELD